MKGWTAPLVERLKELVALKWTYSHIARELGNGLSRDACIGKARRLNLDPPAPHGGKGRKRQSHVPHSHVRKSPAIIVIPDNEPLAIGPSHDFPSGQTCRFIRADVDTKIDWRCCGAPAARFDIPWCPFHLVIVSPAHRKEAA